MNNKMKIKFFQKVNTPTRSHKTDGGLDLYLPNEFKIKPFETLALPLGIGVEIPVDHTAMIVPRSSIAKKGLMVHTSLIDRGYTGEIHLVITNVSGNNYNFNKNDRLCSLVILNIATPVLEIVSELPESDRGNGGFGSTGK